MKNSQTLTLLNKKHTFQILDSIEIELEITSNPFGLSIEDLFTMAARINKKRSFLFVSKVLGKHLPIDPKKGLLIGALLAARFIEDVKNLECLEKEKFISSFYDDKPSFNTESYIDKSITPIIIGFAETATALGHAFFDCFQSADYFHTTREEIPEREPEITFEEEHSHATAHRCYIQREMIANNREIILVDDEITTGKTALNIIQSIHSKHPRDEYTIVSILDWRSEEDQQEFIQLENRLGVTIHVVSLLSGRVQVKQVTERKEGLTDKKQSGNSGVSVEFFHLSSIFTSFFSHGRVPYIEETGRFGLQSERNHSVQQKITEAATILKQKRTGEKTLCLGTGEFMYIPMKLAAEMGNGVFYQSTTRSPIYIQDKKGYGARYGLKFANPDEQTITNFVYNIPPNHYDEVFVFFEREVEDKNLEPLLRELEKIQLKSVKVVFFSKEV
ncbi:MAG TPA: phosphoribosyltransferase family protein [Neobacillus sp.]